MKRFLIIAACLLCNFKAIAQVKFGLELNAYSSKLKNISPDTIVPYGLSGAKVAHSPSYGIAPAFVLRKHIGKNFSLETGLGYWSNKYKIHLNYYSPFFKHQFDTDLSISLKYIQIPVLLNYEIPMKGILSLVLSGGIRTKILVHQQDNYQDIIYEEIGFSDDFRGYNRIVLAPSIAFAGKWELNKGKSFELGFFATRDAMPFAGKHWGFYENLYPARIFQTGISLKFFL